MTNPLRQTQTRNSNSSTSDQFQDPKKEKENTDKRKTPYLQQIAEKKDQKIKLPATLLRFSVGFLNGFKKITRRMGLAVPTSSFILSIEIGGCRGEWREMVKKEMERELAKFQMKIWAVLQIEHFGFF